MCWFRHFLTEKKNLFRHRGTYSLEQMWYVYDEIKTVVTIPNCLFRPFQTVKTSVWTNIHVHYKNVMWFENDYMETIAPIPISCYRPFWTAKTWVWANFFQIRLDLNKIIWKLLSSSKFDILDISLAKNFSLCTRYPFSSQKMYFDYI